MSDHGTRPVALLDWDEKPIRVVQDAKWKLEDREDSTNRLYVTTSLEQADGVESEQELIFKGRRFSIVEVDRTRSSGRAIIEADEVQAELADLILESYVANSWTLEQALDAALSGTRWTQGNVQGVRFGRANFEEITRLDALKFLARHQDARLSFDSLRRRVNISENAGTTHEIVFTYGTQLQDIEKTVKSPTVTVIYPTGADGMTVEGAELDEGGTFGHTYVEDYGQYLARGLTLSQARARYKKEEYWSDERYEVAENLLRDTQNRLKEEAYEKITYELKAAATVAVDGEDDFDLGVLQLGDTVYVWDQEIDAKLQAEVTAVTTSSDASENRLTLSSLPDSLGSAGTEGRYFGDSGNPNGDRGRSGFQPRPSMPILESINRVGGGLVRWNGQDHDGNYDTIPRQFGTIETRVAKLIDGQIPSPDSDDAFSGTSISERGGGIASVAFGGGGEFAVWFYMVGRDGRTRSEYSEPLVVEVEELVDTDAMREELTEARGDIAAADKRLTAGQAALGENLEHLNEVRLPDLRKELQQGLSSEATRLEGVIETKAGTRIIRATADPTSGDGEGQPAGTIWYRYDTLDDGGELEGMWTWDGSEWSESTLAERILARVHLESGTYGSMSGERLTAHSIRARHLEVSPDNLWRGESDLRRGEINPEDWFTRAGSLQNWQVISDISNLRGLTDAALVGGASPLDGTYRLVHQGSTFRVTPGEEYRFLGTVRMDFGGFNETSWDTVQYRIIWRDADGNNLPLTSLDADIQSGNQELEASWVAPEGAYECEVEFRVIATGPGRVRFWPLRVGAKTGSSMLVRGAVKSFAIDTEEVFSDEAVINKVWADIVRTRLVESDAIVTRDMIATESVTTEKLVITEEMVAELGKFLKIEAGALAANEIESMTFTSGLVTSSTIRSSLFETTSTANRGIKFDSNNLRAWDSNGNMRFQLSATSGNMTATGTFRTQFTGNLIEVYDDGDGGNIRFWSGNNRGSIKSRESAGRLSMIFNEFDGNEGDLPLVGVEQNRALLQFRSQVISVQGSSNSNQRMQFETGGVEARFFGTLLMADGGRTHYSRSTGTLLGSSVGFVGQRPEASGNVMEIRGNGNPVRISSADILIAQTVHDNTTTLGANVRVGSTGDIRRATSASKYKVDPRDLEVPDSLLDLQLKEWIDKVAFERWGELEGKPRPFTEDDQQVYDGICLKRVPGYIAEEVEAAGGEQFVEYGLDGQIEEVEYDRVSLAQIQVEKRQRRADVADLQSKYDALVERVTELEGAL